MLGETAKRELWGQFPNEIIRASAGTGKTFQLSNRYLKLLASGADCQSILATTFTKKGAGEILDRIINRLSDAALDDSFAQRLSGELEWNLTRQRAAKILHDLLKSLHRLEISTLDSFFNRVAKVFALELGLPPSWDIVDEQEINRLHDEVIESVLRNESVIHLLHMLTKGEAARRVASMVRDTVDQIYGIYRESGDEPWDQIVVSGHFLSDPELEKLLVRMDTIELSGARLIKHWEEVKSLASAGDWAGLATTTSFQRSLDGEFKYGSTKLPPEIVEIYQQLIPHCAAHIQTRLIQQNKSTRDLLAAFDQLLEKRKDETGYLRFDDVTERLQKFVSLWDSDRFSFRLDNQIQHLLLDEFQDTSLAQWNVVRPFAKNVTENADHLRSLFCVGDMKQAIFGWRGGVAEIFDLVGDELPNLKPTGLTKSYRSSQPVIDLVNRVFMNVEDYRCDDSMINEAIHQWVGWFDEHTTEKNDLPGYVSIEIAGDGEASQKLAGESEDSARSQNVVNNTIARVGNLIQTISGHHDIGVIVRTNDEVAELIFALQQAGIPASEEGGSSLTDSAAVEIILSAIQLADHPGDSVARFHLSHSPLAFAFGLEPETDANQPLNVEAARVGAAQLRSKLVNDGYGPTVEAMARELIGHCTRRELLRLQQLVRIAFDNPSVGDQWSLRPGRFVQYVREEVKVSDQSSARVRVMTIHKAKGLEFDVVVLPFKLRSNGFAGMTPSVVVGRDRATAPIKTATRYIGEKLRKFLPGDFQAMFENDRQRNVQESMCVLYVAMTRAVHATHIILSHGAKPEHKSPSGILLATVCPNADRVEGLLYEHGDPVWYEHTQSIDREDPFKLADFYLPTTEPLTPAELAPGLRSRRGIHSSSPSQQAGGDEIFLRSVLESPENHELRTRGRLLHGCFELVKWLDEAIPSRKQLETHLKTLDPTIASFDAAIADFYNMIERDNVRKLLCRSTYQETYLMEFSDPEKIMLEANRLEVQTERRFAVQLQDTILEGQIDRLVMVFQGSQIVAADVIDFKTDSIEDTQLQEKIEHYRPQLTAYREAVSQFAGISLEKISARLVFVESGKVVNLDLVETTVDAPVREVKSGRDGKLRGPKRSSRGPGIASKTTSGGQTLDPDQQRQKRLWD